VQFAQFKLLKSQKHLLEANFDFPFFEYHQPAIEAGLKLGMVNILDMDQVNVCFADYKKNFVFPEQLAFLASAIGARCKAQRVREFVSGIHSLAVRW
jgi:hypothetical protein